MIGPLLRREIEHIFKVVAEKCTNDELVFVCPEPECGDRSGNRAINLKTGKTFCWRCGKGKHNKGNFVAWARALGYELTADDYSSVPVGELLYKPEAPASAVPVLQEVDLPKGFIPIARTPKSIYTKLITQMAKRKHLEYQDMVEAGVGYSPDDPLWERYAIFPVYEYNLCVYYQGRTYEDIPGESTKRFPHRSRVKWGAGYWVYNINAVRTGTPETVVLVESILNVLSLRWKLRELGWTHIVPVCIFKHHLSQVQAIKLLRCKGVKEFCLLFDRDAIGEMWRSVGLLGNKVRVTVAEMPLRADNKKLDPNDDVEAAIVAIQNRKLYTSNSANAHLLETEKGLASREFDLNTKTIKPVLRR